MSLDWNNPTQRNAFLDLHSGNPREGPGDFQSAERAYIAAKKALGGEVKTILDLACGPGMQTQHLAQLDPKAKITALDIHPVFVERVNKWCQEHGLSDRVTAVVGDMNQLDVDAGSQDLIWCEGAVYMLGVEAALAKWRPLLRSGGCVAFTEPVFLSDKLPDAVVENWEEYPVMTDVAGVTELLLNTGYDLVESFVLPDNAWAEYYEPLQRRVDALRPKYASVPDAALVIEEGQSEIDAWRNYGEHFSYAFFVVKS